MPEMFQTQMVQSIEDEIIFGVEPGGHDIVIVPSEDHNAVP